MTISAIKTAALHHFALKGYEAASLDMIAREVGIKKQSLYSHFKSKSDLFITVFEEAVQHEKAFIDHYFSQLHAGDSLEDQLYRFIEQYKIRYYEDLNLRIILYLGFMTPEQQAANIQEAVTRYFDYKSDKVRDRFLGSRSSQLQVPVESAVIAYMNTLEGMLVELIYAGTSHFDERLRASWDVYWRGITYR